MRFTLRSDVLKPELGQSTRFNQRKKTCTVQTSSQQRELVRVGSQRRHPQAHYKRGDVVIRHPHAHYKRGDVQIRRDINLKRITRRGDVE